MSKDILEQVIADIKASPVTILLQLDESTDVSNCSLIAVVRYLKNKKIEESFLFCQSLETTYNESQRCIRYDKRILHETPTSLRPDWFDMH